MHLHNDNYGEVIIVNMVIPTTSGHSQVELRAS